MVAGPRSRFAAWPDGRPGSHRPSGVDTRAAPNQRDLTDMSIHRSQLSSSLYLSLMAAGARWVVGAAASAVVVVVGGVQAARMVASDGVTACDVLGASDIERIAAAPPVPFEPERSGTKATGCSYGRQPGVNVIVFSVEQGGRALLRRNLRAVEEHGVVPVAVAGKGYEGYVGPGPTPGSESVTVVRNDHYVNIIVVNAAPGMAEQLGAAAARSVG
jgi:hypothetical protein